MTNRTDNYGWISAESPHSCNYVSPKILDLLAQCGKPAGSLRVLDIGSGNGNLSSQIFQNGYYIVGIEPDRNGFEISKQNYPDIKFYNIGVDADSSDLLRGENNKLFDVVVSTEVIEHLFSPHLLPQFAYKALSQDGCLIISTPYHGYLKNLAMAVFNKWDFHHHPIREGGHIKFWSRKTLTQLLFDNRFHAITFYGVGRFPYLWKSMIIVARKIG